MGEGGGFPGSAKAVAEWFPRNERSLAVGVFNSGSSLGALIAPPLLAWIVTLSYVVILNSKLARLERQLDEIAGLLEGRRDG